MLKIKDEVDLKELEKFGFKFGYGFYEKNTKYIDYYIGVHYKNPRVILIRTEETDEYTLDDTLYDLIQAGLVEKVEG